MNIYEIRSPYVSNSLKRFYNKDLEIIEYKKVTRNDKEVLQAIRLYKYNNTTEELVQTEKFKTFNHFKDIPLKINDNIITAGIFNTKRNAFVEAYFYDLEMAFISKMFLIHELQNYFNEELNSLKIKGTNKLININKVMNKQMIENPQYFL